MGSESSFTPEAFSFSGDNGEESASSSSLFSDTRKSLDAFLAQERDGGFLSEICTCADDEKERGASRTSKKKKNSRQKKANASGARIVCRILRRKPRAAILHGHRRIA